MNFLEQLPIVMFSAAISGVGYPTQTFYACIAYSIGRLMYGFGYMQSPKLRGPGAISQALAVLAMLGMAYTSAY